MYPETIRSAEDLEKAFLEWNIPIYRYIFLRVQNQATAEEIAQDTFAKAWMHRESFDVQKSSLKNWLFVIATNLLRDHFRKNTVSIDNIDEMEESLADSTNISKKVSDESEYDLIFDQMKNLSEREQEMLTLRYIQDLSVKEVAEILDMEYSAAKVAFHRAIKKLQVLCQDLKPPDM